MIKLVFIAVASRLNVVRCTYNSNFQSAWPGGVELDTALALPFGDTANLCDPTTATTQACMAQISTTMQNIVSGYNTLNKYFGSGDGKNSATTLMAPWFIGSTATGGKNILQSNFEYLKAAVAALNTLVLSGSSKEIATLLNTPEGQYVNLKTAYAALITNLGLLETQNTNLQSLVSTLTTPVTTQISQQMQLMGNTYLQQVDDAFAISKDLIDGAKRVYDGYAQYLGGLFAGNITLLKDEQTQLVDSIQTSIGSIGESLKQSLQAVQDWNDAQSIFADSVSGAMEGANKALPAMQLSVYDGALNAESTALATSVVQPATLSFATTISDYKSLAKGLIDSGKTNVSRLIEANQLIISGKTNQLKDLTAYYKSLIANFSTNVTAAANSSATTINETFTFANTSQIAWQAQMNAMLKGISETIGGVATAAAAKDNLALSLAASVLSKFESLITNLQEKMGLSAQSAFDSLAAASAATGSASSSTTDKLKNSYASGAASSSANTGIQLKAISQSSVTMMGSLADMLLSLRGLINLQQAKVSDSTTASNNAIEMVNSVIAGNTQDLASTINDITNEQQTALFTAKAYGMDSATTTSSAVAGVVAGVAAKTSSALKAAEDMFSDTQEASNRQISDLSAQIADAATASTNLQNALNSISTSTSGTLANLNVTSASLQTILTNTIAALQQAIKSAEASAYATLMLTNQTTFNSLINDSQETNKTLVKLYSEFGSYLGVANQTLLATNSLSEGASKIPLDELSGLLSQLVDSYFQESVSLNTDISTNATGYASNFSGTESLAAQADVRSASDLVTLMTDTAKVPNIANAETTSKSSLDDGLETAVDLLSDITTTSAVEQGIKLQADALLAAVKDLIRDLPLDLAYESGQETVLYGLALESVENETKAGLDASSNLDSLITQTKADLDALNITVIQQISNTTANIDVSTVVDQMNGFLQAVQAQQTDFFNVTSTQAALRASLITGQQADLELYKAKEIIGLISAKSDYATRQSTILKIADQLSRTIGGLATISGGDVSAILAKLSAVRQVSDRLSSSLEAYVSSAGARMQAEASLAAKNLKKIAEGNVMKRSLAVQAMTVSMTDSLDIFNMTTQSLATMAAGTEGGIVGVNQMVQNLNATATVELQNLLRQVEDGTMSLQGALRAASKVSSADLGSIGDIANAFSTIIYQYLALTEQTYSDAEIVLGDFNASASDTVNGYAQALFEAITPVKDIVSLSQNVSGSLGGDLDAILKVLKSNLTTEQSITSDEVVSVAQTTSYITSLIDSATKDYAEIEQKESDAVAALAHWAQINYHGLLASAAPQSMALEVDSKNLAWTK